MGLLRTSLRAVTTRALRYRLVAPAFEKLSTSLFYNHVALVKSRQAEAIYRDAGGRVQDGPFRGLHLSPTANWGHDMVAMLLGQYEREVVEALFARDLSSYGMFVDIGAANGFFAVGMARAAKLPVIAYERDAASQGVIKANADLNGVSLDIRGEATASVLDATLAGAGRALVLVDIEGAEIAVLDPVAVPHLANADLVVESHDVEGRRSVDVLTERLAGTHEAKPIAREGRNPFAFPRLSAIPDNEAWICLSEERGAESGWVLFEAKAGR
ncbi:MAG: hypothetical protein K2Y56_25905 [Methylobacterium sp.]|uniref:hypothetical protein n=1 Tax=Methylobacterium sp. TaxID=409 RepID=UPI0025CD1F09|nr:hypothetical protein [Methylobacterium sp.]MBX9934900.1 hypothetical protein [Methylobacterium sp.]